MYRYKKSSHFCELFVPGAGIEPARSQWPLDFKSSASTNSATWAFTLFAKSFERETGLGPATPTLARSCSTNWAILAFAILKDWAFSHLPCKDISFFFTCKQIIKKITLKMLKNCELPSFQDVFWSHLICLMLLEELGYLHQYSRFHL